MKPLVIAALGALVLTGCGKVRYPTSYLLNLPPVPQAASGRQILGPVSVHEFGCPDYLCEGRIVYRPTPEEVGFYEYHRWASNPRQAITQSIADALGAQAVFKSVSVSGRSSEAAYVLTGKIEQLEEVDQDGHVRAVCTISAQLTDSHAGAVIWSHTESQTVAVEKRNMAGVVSGLSTAAQKTIERLVVSMTNQVDSLAYARDTEPRP